MDDVASAIDCSTTHPGFTVRISTLSALADVRRGQLRLLLSGPQVALKGIADRCRC